MSDTASAIDDMYAGDASSVGITGIMGQDSPTWGDYSGPSVFDNLNAPEVWSGEFSDMNPYDFSSTIGEGAGGLFGTGMNLSQIARLAGQGISLGSGINALSQARNIGRTAQQGAAAADPLAAYRPELAAKLMELIRDPSSIQRDPGYTAGLQAVQRAGAAQGFTGSGNMMTALADYGGSFYENAIRRLAGLTGGTPGGGANLALQGAQSQTHLTNAGINRIASGIASMATGLFGDD